MDAPVLDGARMVLQQAGLVAYKKPLYQVLPIGDVLTPERTGATGEAFKKLAGGSR